MPEWNAGRVLLCSLVIQAFFWWLVSPWPQLSQPRHFDQAVLSCLWAGGILGLFPLLTLRVVARTWSDGIRMVRRWLSPGDWRSGLVIVAVSLPGFTIGTFFGARDAGIRQVYPWPGPDIASTREGMLAWFAWYLVYYIAFEFFYRGYLVWGLRSLGVAKAIGIQAVMCALFHLGKPPIEVLASLPASFFFGWVAWRTGSIWYGLAIHFAVGIANDLGALWHAGTW